jgi:hypothetical protein
VSVRSLPRRGTGGTRSGLAKRMSMVAFAAVAIAACGSGTSGTPSGAAQGNNLFNPSNFNTSNISWLSANQNASGSPWSRSSAPACR